MLSKNEEITLGILLTKFGVADFGGIVVLVISILCLITSLVWLIFMDKGKNVSCRQTDKAEQKHFFLYASVGIAMYALTWISVLLTGL